MTLLQALGPRSPTVPLLALSGGGGKTTALFALASELADSGARVLVTTTTRIRDPRAEGRRVDAFLEDPGLAPGAGTATRSRPLSLPGPKVRGGSVSVLCAGVAGGKLVGVDPGAFPILAGSGRWDAILVEADGARMRPIKAPAPYEPVWPDGVTSALGLVGLDCLGRPLDDRIAQRPERLGPVAGLKSGADIRLEHVIRLALHPEGLFSGAPAGVRRILVLNKADLRPDLDPEALAAEAAELLAAQSAGPDGAAEAAPAGRRPAAGAGIELVLVCSLGDPEPSLRVRASRKVFSQPAGRYTLIPR